MNIDRNLPIMLFLFIAHQLMKSLPTRNKVTRSNFRGTGDVRSLLSAGMSTLPRYEISTTWEKDKFPNRMLGIA